MINIYYVHNYLSGAEKAFLNYIKFNKYDINMTFEKEYFLEKTFYDFVTLNDNSNLVKTFDNYFLFASFLKNNFSLQNLETDYNAVKTDLNFTLDFKAFSKHISKVDELAIKIARLNFDYVFIRTIFEDTFIRLYLAYKIKTLNKKIKIVIGDGNKPTYFETFYYFVDKFIQEGYVDALFWGFGENLIDDIMNNKLTAKREDFKYTENMFISYSLNVSDSDIKSKMFVTNSNIVCTNNCKFCNTNKTINKQFNVNISHLDAIVDYYDSIKNKHNLNTIKMEGSLSFKNDQHIQYFYNLMSKRKNDRVFGSTLTPVQFYNNFEILNNSKNSFFVGLEHVSEEVLKAMRKPTSSHINKFIISKLMNCYVKSFFIYNFLNEDLENFNELLSHYLKIKNNPKSNISIDIIKLVYSSTPTELKNDEINFSFVLHEPKWFKEYFNINTDIFFKSNSQYDKYLHQKNNLLKTFKITPLGYNKREEY